MKKNTTVKQYNISRKELRKRSDTEIKELVDALLKKMTIKEKIGQLYLGAFSNEYAFGPDFKKNNSFKLIKEGRVGLFIGPYDNKITYELQHAAMHDSRLKIPLLFANDIIHGCRTAFPINIALAGMFHLELVEEAAKVIAYETSHSGTNLTLSPMLDIARDPRWGRVMESPGEDPYLASELAKSYVKGYQQNNLLSYNSIGTCLKHYLGYGQAEAGRDYNTVDMSERVMREIYLKPFEAGINAGACMVMSSFNVYDSVPISANPFMLRTVLRDELHFDGVTISDYASTEETIEHKIARDKKEAAKICVEAGLDVEIITTSYIDTLEETVKEDPNIIPVIDEAVARILTLKYKLGLFDNPYKNIYPDFLDHFLLEEHLEVAKKASYESIVLLKNSGMLPLSSDSKIALIGPFANSKEVVGGWGGKANNDDSVTLLEGFNLRKQTVKYALGTNLNKSDESELSKAIDIAKQSDVIVVTLGEHQWSTGEAASKANLDFSFPQLNLLRKLKDLNKPLIAIVFSGRPMMLKELDETCDAVIQSWFLGTMSGVALADTILGYNNPSARLAMSFPLAVGQIPLYYNHLNTGRPAVDPNNYYTSKYLDCPNDPLYPFGYGLSYSEFTYDTMTIDKNELHIGESLVIDVTVSNISDIAGKEVVQLYIEALSFSVSRPVNELKGFKKVYIEPHQTKQVQFVLQYNDLAYRNIRNKQSVEKREYAIKVGSSSAMIKHSTIIHTK